MPSDLKYLYWDANVFLAFIKQEAGRVDIIEQILTECSEKGERKVITSTFSIIEVSFTGVEKQTGILDPSVEKDLDAMWSDRSAIDLIDCHEDIAKLSRDLMRYSVENKLGLRPKDAVHLA